MTCIEPGADELCLGYEGRLVLTGGHASVEGMYKDLHNGASDRVSEARTPPKLALLAAAAEMAPDKFARWHSMLGALRISARSGLDLVHGSPESFSILKRSGMLTPRRGAFCCQACIEDDMQRTHTSWFHRVHHLVGVDRCPTHGVYLWAVEHAAPFSTVPHEWRNARMLRELAPCEVSHVGETFLERLATLSVAALNRERPAAAYSLCQRLQARAAELGLRTSIAGSKPLLSAQLRKFVPREWIARHVPGLLEKQANTRFERIDD